MTTDRTRDDEADEAFQFRDWEMFDQSPSRPFATRYNMVIDDLIERAGDAVMSDGKGEGTNCYVRDWLSEQKVPLSKD